MSIAVAVVAVFFLLMGLLALVSPARITATFGITALTAEGRNEVRAVYGGFGVAIAALLFTAAGTPALRHGAFTAVAAAVIGMSVGRLVAAAVERPSRFYPSWFYCLAEAAMAGVLFAAR